MVACGCLWLLVVACGCLWLLVVACGCLVLLGVAWCCLVLLGVAWCCLVLLGVACWCLLVLVVLLLCCCCVVVVLLLLLLCVCVVCVVFCVVCVVDVFKIFGSLPRTPPPSAGPPFSWTAQNFALFFSLPPEISFFLLFLVVFSWNCGRGSRPWPTRNAGFGWCHFVKPRRPDGEQRTHHNEHPTPQKKNWPNAVWPNSVNKNWPNSGKKGWPNAAS